VNTLFKPQIPSGSEPSDEDDPTGVRALLSALPEPDPMPEHLVERINASLAAEQAQRATTVPSSPVAHLATTRRRRGRLLFAIAGAAAAVAVVAVVGTNMFTAHQAATISSGRAAVASAAGSGQSTGGPPPNAAGKVPGLAGIASAPSVVQIRQSGTRYTRADFVAQAESLRSATVSPSQSTPAASPSPGPAGTVVGLKACLSAIGAAAAQVVHADVAFYEGQPAVIIVTTTNGIPMAYAVSRQCSRTDAAILRPATRLS
jgi:negative regulator of sigma E activity